MRTIFGYLAVCICALVMFGCGGGGGGGTGGGSKVEPDPVPTTAVVKLYTEGVLPEGTSLAGIGITINLPAGMTVQMDGDGKVAAGTVEGSGVTAGKATLAEPDYTPATDTAPAKLSFVLAGTDAEGFGTGEFATVNCNVTAAVTPQATDITLSDFRPVDLRGAAVEGVTAAHTAEFK
ncbi:MAG: hypothetical protein A2X58_11025 [Nitrospirae bacterium GWC2_56_14]|nr:MAG: hypothetical protein A2X58_11025 [Nitrospirae bacterium GWC2_56_14]